MGLLSSLKKQTRLFVNRNKIYLFKIVLPGRGFKTEDSIIISSETRSGSTWLMNLIYAVPDLVINWEPLHEIKGVVPDKLKWGERPYIPEESDDLQTKQLVDNILSFKLVTKNSVRYCRINSAFKVKKVLTKMVRSNLLLPYIVHNFNLKHKPILLLRHPIAVAKSQLKNIPENQKGEAIYEIPDTLNNDRYKENYEYLNSLKTQLERQVALWCIHSMEIINHKWSGKKWTVVYYEEILLDPITELQRISKEIDLDIPIDESLFKKPSQSDFFHDYQDDKKKQLSKWMDGLSQKELQSIQKIFDHYNLKNYTADQIMPTH